jgi:hypothetical protein
MTRVRIVWAVAIVGLGACAGSSSSSDGPPADSGTEVQPVLDGGVDAPGSAAEAAPPDTAPGNEGGADRAGDAVLGAPCGSGLCPAGMSCCNAVLGLCAVPGTACIQSEPSDAASSACALDQPLTFGRQGAFTLYHDQITIDARGSLSVQRMLAGGDGPLECGGQLACADVASLREALANGDVTNALASPVPPSYGRPVPDVGTFVFRTAAGRGFDLEGVEDDATVPPGLHALEDLLDGLEQKAVAATACGTLP